MVEIVVALLILGAFAAAVICGVIDGNRQGRLMVAWAHQAAKAAAELETRGGKP